MANLKEVRNRIVSVSSTQQITKAMKMVSAAKLRRATDAIVQLRPYAKKLNEILGNLSANVSHLTSPYLQEREVKNVLLIPISSNRGLAGAFNVNVIKMTNQLIAERYVEYEQQGTLHILAIGKKVHEYYTRRNYSVLESHNELFNHLTFENVSIIAAFVMDAFLNGVYDKVELIYNEFKNPVVQILTHQQLLPVPQVKREIKATKLKTDYLLEPSQSDIISTLIPKSVKIQLFKALLDSYASEHGARMTSMDKATENAGDLIKSLKLSYNQARQAAITTEILEIVSGANALSGS